MLQKTLHSWMVQGIKPVFLGREFFGLSEERRKTLEKDQRREFSRSRPLPAESEEDLIALADRCRQYLASTYEKKGPLTSEILNWIENDVHGHLTSYLAGHYRVPEEYLEYAEPHKINQLMDVKDQIDVLKSQVQKHLEKGNLSEAVQSFQQYFNAQFELNFARHMAVATNLSSVIRKYGKRLRQLSNKGTL